MNVKIYQINSDRDSNSVKFWDLKYLKMYQESDKVDASIYDEVFDGELDVTNLEEVFCKFNQEGHPFFRGHSLSVSDVVLFYGKTYFCQSFGFAPVDFDISAVHKPANLIKVLYVEPHKAPYVAELENTIRGIRRAVQGTFAHIYNDDGTIFVINDANKINGMEVNSHLDGDLIAGPFFVAGGTGSVLCSLTDEQLSVYAAKFAEPENISQEEVTKTAGFFVSGIF